MSLSFTFATVTLEVRSYVDHIAVLFNILEARVIVVIFFNFYSSLWVIIDSESFSQLRREYYLDRLELGMVALDLFFSRAGRFFVFSTNWINLSGDGRIVYKLRSSWLVSRAAKNF